MIYIVTIIKQNLLYLDLEMAIEVLLNLLKPILLLGSIEETADFLRINTKFCRLKVYK